MLWNFQSLTIRYKTMQVTTWYMQFPKSYHVHNPIWLMARLKDHTKVNIKFGWNFDVDNISSCNVTTWCRQFQRSYYIHKVLPHAAIWPWPSFKGHKGQTKVNIKFFWGFDMENIPGTLQHDAYNSWAVHKGGWKWVSLKGCTKVNAKIVQYFDVENIPIKLQHDNTISKELICSQAGFF